VSGGLEDEKQIPPLRCGMTTRKAMTARKAIAARKAVGTRRAIATVRIDQSLESRCNWLSAVFKQRKK
jgi:hypothetical protein